MIEVNSQSFHGPMDLLLQLVEQSKIDIYEIQIASITEQFVAIMQEMDISSEELSDFIRMASILVFLKARSLQQDQLQEEEDIPSQEELLQHLVEYRRLKAVKVAWEQHLQHCLPVFSKLPEDFNAYQPPVTEWIPGDILLLSQALQRLQKKKTTVSEEFEVDAIVNIEEISLEQIQHRIRDFLHRHQTFTWSDLFLEAPTKTEKIVYFLSLLELSRMREISLTQKGVEIVVIKKEQADGLTETASSH